MTEGIEENGSGTTTKDYWPYYKIFAEGGIAGRKVDGRNTTIVQCSIQ